MHVWFSEFLVFYCLVFFTKYFKKSSHVLKVFKRGMEGKDFFYFICLGVLFNGCGMIMSYLGHWLTKVGN